MNDVKRALLGDHEAAKRLTDAGVLLPCPLCGHKTELKRVPGEACFWIQCTGKECEIFNSAKSDESAARLAWNTRAPILSAEEMEMLEGME